MESKLYFNRGVEWAIKGDMESAIADFDEAIRLNPKYADAYANRGVVWSVLGDIDLALADFNEAIRLTPQYTDASHNSENAPLDKEEKDQLIDDYNEAIRLNSQYALVYYFRGLTWEFKNDLAQAIIDLRNFVRLEPNDPDGPKAIKRIEDKINSKKLIEF